VSEPSLIYKIGDRNRRRFITMEYLEDKTLKHLVSRPMELERLLTVAIDVVLPK
jgi:hypothetical protein